VMRCVLTPCLALCLLLTGCGGVFVGFVSNPGGTMSASGTVVVVQLGFIRDPTGATINFTAVTLVNPGTAVTINFCGDQRSSFPMNRLVRADFNTGFYCSPLVAVVIMT
jgi:hypothetical protein